MNGSSLILDPRFREQMAELIRVEREHGTTDYRWKDAVWALEDYWEVTVIAADAENFAYVIGIEFSKSYIVVGSARMCPNDYASVVYTCGDLRMCYMDAAGYNQLYIDGFNPFFDEPVEDHSYVGYW